MPKNSTSPTEAPVKLSSYDPTTRTFFNLDEYAEACLDSDQQRAVAKFTRSLGGLCWWLMGLGKTRISLFWFAMLQNTFKWSTPCICVIVCRRRAFLDWREEIEKLFPACDVWENDIPDHPPSPTPCFLLLSEALLAKSVPIYAKMRTIRAVIYDELWLYANPKSAKAEAAYRFGMGRKTLGLSGTVMKARDTAEVWAQARCVSKHIPLATSLTAFRSRFQITTMTQMGAARFPTFSSKPGAYREMMSELEFCADVYFPPSPRRIVEQYHTVPATAQQAAYFRELRTLYSIEEHQLEFNSALATAIKAQQISDGFIKLGEEKYVDFPSNKIEKLKDELELILAAGHRAVVWCAFRHSVEILSRSLPFATLQMVGGADFDVDAWRNGDAKICLATEASGSSVNHFKDTQYALYYSANYKWLDMGQSQFRTNRKDSAHNTCVYKYLQVEGSLDAHVYRVAMGSGKLEHRLVKEGEVFRWIKGE